MHGVSAVAARRRNRAAAAAQAATFEITSVKYVDPYQADVGVTYCCTPDFGSDPNIHIQVDHSAGSDFSEGGSGGADVECDGQSHTLTVRAEGDREWVCDSPSSRAPGELGRGPRSLKAADGPGAGTPRPPTRPPSPLVEDRDHPFA